MIFLGTAAGDLIPSPFCECPICAAARKSGERRHKRYHSMLLLDEENLIDFGPELGAACIEFGLSLSRLRNVFLTHFHEDHFAFSLLPLLQMARTDHPKLTFWMSAPARAAIEGLLKSAGAMGSEAAIEAADVVLMDDDPMQIAKCIGIVKQNIVFSLIVKFACLALTAIGLANMWAAIFADVGVMVLAVLNAVRALRYHE